jgi:hypothetical protein
MNQMESLIDSQMKESIENKLIFKQLKDEIEELGKKIRVKDIIVKTILENNPNSNQENLRVGGNQSDDPSDERRDKKEDNEEKDKKFPEEPDKIVKEYFQSMKIQIKFQNALKTRERAGKKRGTSTEFHHFNPINGKNGSDDD